GGANWFPVNAGLIIHNLSEVYSIVIDPKGEGVIFAGTGDGIFKSNDGGNSWSQVTRMYASVNVMAFDRSDSKIIYAGLNSSYDEGSMLKSTDRGTSWTAIKKGAPKTGLQTEIVSAIAIDP